MKRFVPNIAAALVHLDCLLLLFCSFKKVSPSAAPSASTGNVDTDSNSQFRYCVRLDDFGGGSGIGV